MTLPPIARRELMSPRKAPDATVLLLSPFQASVHELGPSVSRKASVK
jgi:hypothetical protein